MAMTMTMTVTVNEVWDLRLGICTWNCETHVCVERLDLTRVHHSLSLAIKQNEKCCCKKKKKKKRKENQAKHLYPSNAVCGEGSGSI